MPINGFFQLGDEVVNTNAMQTQGNLNNHFNNQMGNNPVGLRWFANDYYQNNQAGRNLRDGILGLV